LRLIEEDTIRIIEWLEARFKGVERNEERAKALTKEFEIDI